MKAIRIITATLISVIMALSISGCLGETTPVTVVLKNTTEYELEQIIFQIPPTRGSYSPMNDLLTSEDESLKPNEEREFVIYMFKSDFGNEGWALVFVEGNEYVSGIFTVEGNGTNRFDINCDDEMNFTLTAIRE